MTEIRKENGERVLKVCVVVVVAVYKINGSGGTETSIAAPIDFQIQQQQQQKNALVKSLLKYQQFINEKPSQYKVSGIRSNPFPHISFKGTNPYPQSTCAHAYD